MKKHRTSLSAEIASHGLVAELEPELIQRGFGEKVSGKWWLFPEEALFLVEKGKIKVKRDGKEVGFKELLRIFSSGDKKFMQRYAVYKDLRSKGYLVKAGAKYGADFRVYEKGIDITRPKGERGHSKYLVLVLRDDEALEVKFLLGLNRVAHSVRKKLLLAIVDRELDVVYLEVERLIP